MIPHSLFANVWYNWLQVMIIIINYPSFKELNKIDFLLSNENYSQLEAGVIARHLFLVRGDPYSGDRGGLHR